MDYKYKYLKYKSKYLKLKGGNPLEETDFENEAKFKKIGQGQQGKIYNLYGTNFAYKVFKGLTTLRGVWADRRPIVIGGALLIEGFNNIAHKYKRASDLELGPHFYKSYIFTQNRIIFGVIVMECISGETIKNLRDTNKLTPEIERRYNELCYKLDKNGLFDSDSHEDNFMVDRDTGRVLGIDF